MVVCSKLGKLVTVIMVTHFYGVILRSGVRETTLSTECLASGNMFFLFSSKFNGTLFFPLPEPQHPRLGLLPLPFTTHNRASQCGPDSILTLVAAAYACSLSPRRTKTSNRLIRTPYSHRHILHKHGSSRSVGKNVGRKSQVSSGQSCLVFANGIDLAQNRNRWWALANAVMNIWDP
jgi:hypothetical protein